MFPSRLSSLSILTILLPFVHAGPTFVTPPYDNITDFQTLASRQAATPLQHLFPVGQSLGAGSWWTTARGLNGARELSDATLRPQNRMADHPHTYTNAPDGSRAMRVTYKKGSYSFKGPKPGGVSFYALGPAGVDMATAKELTFGYSVYVDQSFDFVKGGKLPGPAGGDNFGASMSCGGGSRRKDCFSLRLMFRTNGMGESYAYLPTGLPGNDDPNVCNAPPFSHCNPQYGASVGRGAYTYAKRRWTTVTQHIRLNNKGKADGRIRIYANGKQVIDYNGITLVQNPDTGAIRNIMPQSFYGGSDESWAPKKDMHLYMKDFSVAIIKRR